MKASFFPEAASVAALALPRTASPHRAAVLLGALAVVAGGSLPAAALDEGPSACAAIERAELLLDNLDTAGKGRLVLRGRLPQALIEVGSTVAVADLRIEDLGSAGAPLFAMAASSAGHDQACVRLGGGRGRARRAQVFAVGCSLSGPTRSVLRIARGRPNPAGTRFVLRVGRTNLPSPLGALRATAVFGQDESRCGRWTFAPEDCALADDGALRCRSRATEASADCKRTGCSGQLCSDEHVATTCEYRAEYACYRDAECARQASGECGWTATEDLARCLAESLGPPFPPPVPGLPRDSWFACSADADCVVYEGLDCCGCAFGGGPEVAIHRGAKEEIDAYRLCPDVACPAEYLCRDGLAAACREGRCALE